MLIIDLSNNNTVRDLSAARKNGVVGVWLKVSEGRTFIDPDYQRYRKMALDAGLRVGGYHFARPDLMGGSFQARNFVALLGKVGRRDMRPVLDIEVNDRRSIPLELENWCRDFVKDVRDRTGVCPIVYSNAPFLQSMQCAKPFGCGLWLAAYGADDGKEHPYGLPKPWTGAVAHQFTSKGRIIGIDGNVDLTYAKSLRPLLAHPIMGRV